MTARDTDPDFALALQKCREENSILSIAVNVHNRRSDHSANQAKHIPIYGGVDYFSMQPFFTITLLQMWHTVWTHGRKIKTYTGFRTLSAGDVNEDYMNCLDIVSLLRQPSTWSTGANDLLPLALANHTGRIGKIFCSQKHQPVTDTQPTLTKSDNFTRSTCCFLLQLLPLNIMMDAFWEINTCAEWLFTKMAIIM